MALQKVIISWKIRQECHLNGSSEKCKTYFIFNFANVIGKVIDVYNFIHFIFWRTPIFLFN